MTAAQIEEALSLTEHSRRQLESDGVLVPVVVGRKKVYPRWQAFDLLGLVDPDMAAADAAREMVVTAEAPSVMDDAPSNLIPLDPPRNEVAHAQS